MKKRNHKKRTNHWFVVIWSRRGKTEAGVHKATDVRISGKRAFVMFSETAENAWVVDSSCIFRSAEKAEAAYAGHGALTWLIATKRHSEDVEVHHAFVKRGARTDHWSGSSHIVRLKSGHVLDSGLTITLFDSEEEAKEAAKKHYRDKLIDVGSEIRKLQTEADRLQERLDRVMQ